jgi:hypothetical protein
VPTYLTGRLMGSAPAGGRLLVAVNGRVAGSTYTFRVGGQTMFSSMVPETSMRPGANDVALIQVEGDGEDRTLSAVAVESTEPYRLVERDRSEVILRGDQVVANVRSGAVRGFVERVVEDGGTIRTRGWAATPDGPAERIVVFANEQLIGQGRPTDPRDDVAKAMGPAALRSEFTISGVPEPGTKAPDVRVFAIRGRLASELQTYTEPRE